MITLDSSGVNGTNDANFGVNPLSFTNTAGNFLYFACMFDGYVVSAGATYCDPGSILLTDLYNTKLDANVGMYVGYLHNPPTGAITVQVNFVGSGQVQRMEAMTFSGVNAVTPVGGNNHYEIKDSATSITTTVTVQGTSGMVVDAFFGTNMTDGNAKSPQTEKNTVNGGTWGGGTPHFAAMSYQPHTGSNITMEWDNFTGGSGGNIWKMLCALELLPTPAFVPQIIFM